MNDEIIVYILVGVVALLCFVIIAIQLIESKLITSAIKKQQEDVESIKNKDTGLVLANVVKEKVAKELAINEDMIEISQIRDIQSLKISDGIGKELCTVDFDIPKNYLMPKESFFNENKQLKTLIGSLLGEGIRKSDVFIKAYQQNGMFLARFSPEVSKGLKTGVYKLVKQGTKLEAYCRETGKFKEIAQNVGPAGGVAYFANPVMIALAAWQIMATITLQHYLTSMDSKMTSVLDGVWDLKYKINNDRIGKIESSMNYLRNVQNKVKKGYVNQENIGVYLSQMEIVERDIYEIIYACNMDVKSYINKTLASVKTEQDMDGCVKNLIRTIDEYNYIQQTVFSAECTLVLLEQDKSILGVNNEQIEGELNEIANLIEKQQLLAMESKNVLFDGINKLKGGFFTREKKEIESQESVKNRFKNYECQWNQNTENIREFVKEQLNMTKKVEITSHNDIVLAIKLDENMNVSDVAQYLNV